MMMTAPRRKKIIAGPPKGYTAYSICRALVLHINSPSYDMKKYGSKSKSITVNAFNKLKENEKILYAIIEKNCDNDYNQILRLMMFFMNDYSFSETLGKPHKKIFVIPGEIVHGDLMEKFDMHMTRKFHGEQSFHEDLKSILEINGVQKDCCSVRKTLYNLLMGTSGTEETIAIYNRILSEAGSSSDEDMLAACNFSFDTLIILDKIGNLSQKILNNETYEDTPYADLAKRINKLSKLYEIDRKKYEKFILNYCDKNEEN